MLLKNLISIFFVVLSCFVPCAAQNSGEQFLFPIWDERGKYGLIDESGRIHIKPQKEFFRCGDFSEGFAVVDVIDRNFGESTHSYINKKGEFVIGGFFVLVEPFSDGWARVDPRATLV